MDEFHVDPDDTARVRDALTRFADEQLRDGDLVIILKPLDPLTSIRPTADRAALRAAIAAFEGRRGQFEPRSPIEEETLGRAPALVEAGRAQVVLSALRALAAQLGSSPGRSAILFVSEGFTPAPATPDAPRPARSRRRRTVRQSLRRADLRLRSAAEPSGPTPGGVVLSRLVSETGGTLSRGADLSANLAKAALEIDSGYTLTYQPLARTTGAIIRSRCR